METIVFGLPIWGWILTALALLFASTVVSMIRQVRKIPAKRNE